MASLKKRSFDYSKDKKLSLEENWPILELITSLTFN
jgi:hypothetical protein